MTEWVDHVLNIDTVSPPAGTISYKARFDDSVAYVGYSYVKLWKYVSLLRPSSEDVVFDVGCGMGRILCTFARRSVRKCVGIEISAELAERARQNAAQLKGRKAPVEIRVGDAAEADYSEGTIYCFFNPFGIRTLQAVLQGIRESVESSPRRIRVAYFNAVFENVMESCGWLRCYGRRESLLTRGWGKVSLWTNEDSKVPR